MLQFLFNKVAGLKPETLLKKSLQHRCFPVEFAKFLRTSIMKNIFEGLFLIARKQLRNAKSPCVLNLVEC